MPLNRQKFVSKFQQVIPLTQYQASIHGGYEYLTVNFGKSFDQEKLAFVSLAFPPLEGEHASKYALLISLFWVCILPDKSPADEYITRSTDALKKTGSYLEEFGDVRVTLSKLGGMFSLRAETVVAESKTT